MTTNYEEGPTLAWRVLPLFLPASVHDYMIVVAETSKCDDILEFIRYFQDTHVRQ